MGHVQQCQELYLVEGGSSFSSLPVPCTPPHHHFTRLKAFACMLATKFRVMLHLLFIPKMVLNSLLEDLIFG